jgi:hypothetical protein
MSDALQQYVVWDGLTEKPYIESNVHDCMVTHDLQTISVQSLRNEFISKGLEPIVMFGCESGGTCVIDSDLPNSVFTYFYLQHFDLETTLRNLISAINKDVWKNGYEQKAEVIGRAYLLDVPIRELEGRPECTVMLMQFDMCRRLPDDE